MSEFLICFTDKDNKRSWSVISGEDAMHEVVHNISTEHDQGPDEVLVFDMDDEIDWKAHVDDVQEPSCDCEAFRRLLNEAADVEMELRAHRQRVTELLEANNQEVERRRAVERQLEAVKAATEKYLGLR